MLAVGFTLVCRRPGLWLRRLDWLRMLADDAALRRTTRLSAVEVADLCNIIGQVFMFLGKNEQGSQISQTILGGQPFHRRLHGKHTSSEGPG